jgi:MFS family permease
VITQISAAQELQGTAPLRSRKSQRRPLPPLRNLLTKNLSALLLSAGLFEVTSNIVYVMLMERTFDLSGGAAGVGVFLVLQAGAQLLLGPVVGTFADNLGARRAAIFGLLGLATLSLGLANASSIGFVYLLALHVTIARLLVITSRLPLVSKLSAKTGYLGANSAISTLEGIGLLLGPAIAAALVLIWNESTIPILVSSVLFLLAALPLLFQVPHVERSRTAQPASIGQEIKLGWSFILSHRPVWEVLVCLTISGLTFGSVMPMLTLLARQAGLGAEGSGIFVAALGLGWMLGPLAAGLFIRRLGYSRALLVTGLATPLAALAIGFLPSTGAILIALVIAAFAGGALHVIVTTIIQRLTPENQQGSVIGTEQALSGLIWILSAGFVTIALEIASPDADPRWLFFPIGVVGALMVLACWSFSRRALQGIVDRVAHRIE